MHTSLLGPVPPKHIYRVGVAFTLVKLELQCWHIAIQSTRSKQYICTSVFTSTVRPWPYNNFISRI